MAPTGNGRLPGEGGELIPTNTLRSLRKLPED